MDMPLHPSWFDIAIPLTLTMLAGATIGFNRGAVGTRPGSEQLFWSAWQLARHDTDQHSAAPRRQDVPIICGHGYDAPSAGYSDSRWIYGGGAILRGRSHHGVTTAAVACNGYRTCLGGGQPILGIVTTVLAAVTLLTLKWVEL